MAAQIANESVVIANAAGIESTAKAMSAATIAASASRSGVAAGARGVGEEALALVVLAHRHHAPHQPHHGVLPGVDLLAHPAQDPPGQDSSRTPST